MIKLEEILSGTASTLLGVDANDFPVLSASEAAAAGVATAAAATATAAAESSGDITFYDTKAAATAAVGGHSEGDVIEVYADEDYGGIRTRYAVESSALVYKISLASVLPDILGRPTMDPALLGHRSGGLRLRKALADLAAGTRQSLRILTISDSLGTISWATGHMQLGRLFEPHMGSTPVYGYNYADTLQYALAGQPGSTAAASGDYNASKSNATQNLKTDFDSAFDGTNIEIATGQRAIFSIGNNNVYCDTIRIPIITEPSAGSVKIELFAGNNPPNHDSGTWVEVTEGQIVSSHTLTGSELIIDADDTFGATIVQLSVPSDLWTIKVTHEAGGNVRMLEPMFELAGDAAVNQWRIGTASNDFVNASSDCEPVMAALIANYDPDIICVESDDRLASYQNFLPILEDTLTTAGLSHQPLVVLIGNPFYSNGPYDDDDIAERIAYMHRFASSRVGWDVIDMMAMSGGLGEATDAGWASDGIHYTGEIAWQAVRLWGISRGYYAFQPKEPGGDASFSDINRAFSRRRLTAEKMRALVCSPTVYDTTRWTWASLLTGSGAMAASGVSSYIQMSSGATADSKVVAYLNEAITPIAHNQSLTNGQQTGAIVSQIRITASNADGVLRLLWPGDRAYNAAHGGTLTGIGVGFEVLDDTIKGICWDGSLVTSDYTVAMTIGATAMAYQLAMVMTPYETVEGVYSPTYGVVEWFVNGISLGRERYQMGNMRTPRFELTNGATAAQYVAYVVPPKVMSIFPEVSAA